MMFGFFWWNSVPCLFEFLETTYLDAKRYCFHVKCWLEAELRRTNIHLRSMGLRTSNEFLLPKVHGCILATNQSYTIQLCQVMPQY